MKKLRKWSRILHRDFGYLFFGVTLIYSFSGIALNHLADWNPNYSVEAYDFTTSIDLKSKENIKENILKLITDLESSDKYKKHYYPKTNQMKIFLDGGSSILVDTKTGEGYAEFLKKRPFFYQLNYLHYNPNRWWKWFSDIFAVVLILLALTGLIMVKGKKGITGRGAWLTLAGIILPILFLVFS